MSLYSERREKLRKQYGITTENKGTGSENRQSQTPESGQKQPSGSSLYAKRRRALQEKYNPQYEITGDFISSFVRDAESYVSGAGEAYRQMGYANSGATYETQKKAADGLRSKSYAISRYLTQNRDSYSEEDYLALKKYLTNFDKVSEQYSAEFGKARDYYGQWDTEESYNAYQTAWKEYEEKAGLDLAKADRDISYLERVRNEYDILTRTMTDERGTARLEELRKQYGELADLDRLISGKKAYRNQAEHIQKGAALSAAAQNEDFGDYSGYVSTRSEGWLDRLFSEYGLGYQDLTYEYINNQNGIRDEIESKWAQYNTDSVSMGNQSNYADKGYDLLTEEETAIYNYYYAKEGRDKAQEYLDSIQETLNQRKANAVYSGLEGKTGLELIYGAEAGLDQFITGMQNLFNRKDGYIPATATQLTSAMVREDLADDGFRLPEWMGGASLGQVGYDAITTTANMAPSILASMAANMIVPGSGAVVGTGMMGASAAGNAYQEALNEGYDKKSARAYSTLVGASEAGLQYLLGGISKLGGKVTGKALGKMLDGIDNAFGRVALKLGGNMISEGAEEGLQEILTPLFKRWTLKADEDVNWSEVAYSTLLGALTSGVMEGPSTISRGVEAYKTDREFKQIAREIDQQKAAGTLEEVEAEYGAFGETVRKAYNEGQDISEFAIGFRYAFEIGRQGGSEKALQKVRYITQSQRETAYELGRTAAEEERRQNREQSGGIAASLIGEDGSTEDVTIGEIVSMTPDKMELRLEDGRTVTDEDLSFAGDGAEVLNRVWELGMDAESANEVLRASRGTDLSETELAAGIEEGFRYGRYGYDAQRLVKTQASTQLPDAVRSAAYKAGQAYAARVRESMAVSNSQNTTTEETSAQKKGTLHFDGDRSGLTERQKVSIQALETVAEITGAEIYVEPEESELLNGENGLYNPADEKIHISLNAGDDGKGTMLYTAAHEFTHRIRHRSEAKFQALADFLVAEYVKLGVDVDALVQEQQRRYAEKGIELSYDDAFEEMVASSMEEMFTKGKAIEKMNTLKKRDRTLWEEIKAFVRELAEKVRRVYEGLKPDSAEARYVRAMKEAAEELERLFAEGVMAEKTQKNTTREGGVKYSANANAYDYTKSFAQQLSDFRNGVFPERDTFVLGGTPTVLKNIGMASLPMTINQKHVGDALNGTYKGTQQEKLDHTFTAQELSTLPEKIADPIAIIYDKRTGKANASESNIDVLVEMTVASGKQVICAVQIGGNGHVNGLRIDTNKVATVHGNSDSITRLTDAINEEQKGTVAVFYVNKVKTTKVLQSAGNPIPRGLSNLDGFIHSITDPGSPVKMRISSATELKSQVLNANNFYIRFLLHLYKINNAPQGRRQMIFVAACSQTDM